MGNFFFRGSIAILPSHPVTEGPLPSLEAGRIAQHLPEPASPVTSAYSWWDPCVAMEGEKELKHSVRLILLQSLNGSHAPVVQKLLERVNITEWSAMERSLNALH